MKKLFAMLMLTAAMSSPGAAPALAGDDSCLGTVAAAGEWTTVNNEYVTCRFKTASKVGQRILAVCRVGDECEIMNDLPPNGVVKELKPGEYRTITKMPYRVERAGNCLTDCSTPYPQHKGN
jgi:hypothetical protein